MARGVNWEWNHGPEKTLKPEVFEGGHGGGDEKCVSSEQFYTAHEAENRITDPFDTDASRSLGRAPALAAMNMQTRRKESQETGRGQGRGDLRSLRAVDCIKEHVL